MKKDIKILLLVITVLLLLFSCRAVATPTIQPTIQLRE